MHTEGSRGGGPTLDSASAAGGPAGAGPKVYRVGTLTYTRFGLLSVFFWMLWGDLCVNIMETIIPRLVPLQLQNLHATSTVIGFVSASIPAGVEFAINPFVSTYSDRYRSRIGRRRPFLLACTPILAVCLLAVGFSEKFGLALHRALGGLGMSQAAMTIALMGVLLAVFQFFNVVVLATYYYMIADVVPQQVIGTFTSTYKVVGTLGGVVFNKFIFQFADRYQWQIYLGCALVYLIAFMLMGWRVKEGEYPPPSPLGDKGDAIGAAVHWIRESFTIRFYQKLYLIGLFYWFAIGSIIFQQLFALNELHMSKQAVGDAFAWAGLLSLPLFFVLGPLADKFHPVRMVIVGMATLAVCSFGCFFLIHDAATFKLWTVIWTLAQTMYLGSQISLLPRTMPLEQYGQYCSANNTLWAAGKFGGPVLSGMLIGLLGSNRLGYLWTAVLSVAGVAGCLLTYWHWKRLGGDLHYVPPRLAAPAPPAFEVAPISDPGDMAGPGATAVEAGTPDALRAAPGPGPSSAAPAAPGDAAAPRQ